MSRIPAAQRPQRRRQKATAADPGSYRCSRQDPAGSWQGRIKRAHRFDALLWDDQLDLHMVSAGRPSAADGARRSRRQPVSRRLHEVQDILTGPMDDAELEDVKRRIVAAT